MDIDLAFQSLEDHSYFIWDHFLSTAEVASMCDDFKLRALHFHPASTGKQKSINHTRTDEIDWFDPLDLNSIQTLLWDRLTLLKEKLNEHFYLGLVELEGHYAKYNTGGHYHKHVDRFQDDNARTITLVLYLNQIWDDQLGGELRVYPLHSAPFNIVPLAGRLICFLSAELPHEVLKTNQLRMSFAGWYKTKRISGK